MVELVHVIFSQLDSIPDSLAVTPLAGQHHTPRLTVGAAGYSAVGMGPVIRVRRGLWSEYY